MSKEKDPGSPWKMVSIVVLIIVALLRFVIRWDNHHDVTYSGPVYHYRTPQSQKVTFAESFASLPLLNVGFTASTADKQPVVSIEPGGMAFGSSPMGKLESIEGYHFVVNLYSADILMAMLEVYNDDGEKLNQYPLYDMNYCGIEDDTKHSRFRVDGNWQLTLENLEVRGDKMVVVKSRKLRKRDLIDTLTIQ